MTRKRLPKAIRPSNSDLVLTVVGAVADDQRSADQGAADQGSAAQPTPSREAIEPEWAPEVSPAVPANDTLGARSSNFRKLAAKRRVLAGRIVEQHGTLAAISGLAPLPVVNVAGVAATIMHMLKRLSGLYQVQFERERTRLLVIGILGGAAPTGLGAAAVSTIGLVAPAPAFIGLAVSALTAAAVTRAIGEVFIESFERQAPLG
jgi:uncharacterized protein (DUF697 family)